MSSSEQAPRTANRLPIVAFFVGCAISNVGDMCTLLAIPWFVLQTTGSVTQTGITAFFATLPAVFSAFFGSVLVDRLGYKRTSVIGDLASGITIMLVPFLYSTAGLAFWQLLLLVFLGGLLKSPATTARHALLPDLAELASMRLEQANAFYDGIGRIAGLIGAPLAGVLIAVIGTSNLLWLDAASFAISALLIGFAVPFQSSRQATKSENGYFGALREGVRFIQHDTLVLSFVVVILITNLIDAAFFSVVEPVYIKHIFNSVLPLALITATMGGAAFVGTLLFGLFGHRLPRRLTCVIGYTVGGALRFWIFLYLPILPVLIGWHIIAGLGIAVVNPIVGTVMQERLPAEMRARIFGAVGAGMLAGIPLGTFLSGYVVAWIGLQMTLLIMGILYFVTTLSLLVNPALKAMDVPLEEVGGATVSKVK
ncbi:MFS transporter [Reticulibacter mediterranei]|uniref:MFS transporter n=1 Tax=Reticulibacter mediterranei TaxID=2778369 RepID=A0A8J3IYV4_9CHLR|nr:MFS transporter [Reticulibacter mediterranei]GHP01016.1 MFS transporter [Reticulibacter mediterranei]